MMDTLAAQFYDDLSVDLSETEPADYIAIRKIERLWSQQTTSLSPNARFPYKRTPTGTTHSSPVAAS